MSTEQTKYTLRNTPDTLDEFAQNTCCLLHIDPNYSKPTPDDIKSLRSLMSWSQNDIAKMLGVNFKPDKGSTTVRKWCTPEHSNEHRDIPYASWRLLLIYAGIAQANEYRS